MAKQTQDKGSGKALGMIASVAALSAAAYVLFGPNGKKNQKAIRGWAVKMKGEIIEKFENAKELTEPMYHKIIDQVTEKYSTIKNVDQAELKAAADDMRKHWKAIVKSSAKTAKSK